MISEARRITDNADIEFDHFTELAKNDRLAETIVQMVDDGFDEVIIPIENALRADLRKIYHNV